MGLRQWKWIFVELIWFTARVLNALIFQFDGMARQHTLYVNEQLSKQNVCHTDISHFTYNILSLIAYASREIGNLFSLLLCSLWWVQIFGYDLACRSYSFVCTIYHTIIIIVQTYLKALNLWNACHIYFVEFVSKIMHVLSVIHYTICGAVCFQFTNSPCDDWESVYTLSYYHIKSEVWSIIHCLGLNHETMVSAVCLSIFLWYTYHPILVLFILMLDNCVYIYVLYLAVRHNCSLRSLFDNVYLFYNSKWDFFVL